MSALHLDAAETGRIRGSYGGDVIVEVVNDGGPAVVIARYVKHPIGCYVGKVIMPWRRAWNERNYPYMGESNGAETTW